MVEQMGHMTPEQILKEEGTVIVTFAGALSGGRNNNRFATEMARAFGRDNVVCYNSVSTPEAFLHQGGNLSIASYSRHNQYYENLARQFVEQHASCKKIVLHMQSGGGLEGIDFLNALLARNDFTGEQIDILLTGVPGFAEKPEEAIPRVWEFAKRFAHMAIINTNLDLQDDIYPLPDRCYGQPKSFPEEAKKSNETVYKEGEESRRTRRTRFLSNYFGSYPDEEAKAVIGRLDNFDKQIEGVMENGASFESSQVQKSVRARAKLVVEVDQYRLKHMPAEHPRRIDEKIIGPIISLIYVSRICATVGRGMENHLRQVIDLAESKGVKINASFGVFERDPIITYRDAPRVEKRLEKANIFNRFSDWLVIQGLSHQSVDNTPEGIIQSLKKILKME